MRIVVGALFCVVAACASTSKQPQTAANAGSGSGSDEMVCHEVTDTGSLFSHQECQPKDEAQVERDDAQRYLKTPRATLSPAAGK